MKAEAGDSYLKNEVRNNFLIIFFRTSNLIKFNKEIHIKPIKVLFLQNQKSKLINN
jgi:hypothetical protein